MGDLAPAGDLGRDRRRSRRPRRASTNRRWRGWTTTPRSRPRSFVAQMAALAVAELVTYVVLFSLSFMAAESLSRRAFPHHPQFWKVWGPVSGRSPEVLAAPSRLPAGSDLRRLRSGAVSVRHAIARLVDAVRDAVQSRRARVLRTVALGDRQVVSGRVLGGIAVSRHPDRRRRADRRSPRQPPRSGSPSRSSCRRSSSAPATRRIRPNRPTPGRSS